MTKKHLLSEFLTVGQFSTTYYNEYCTVSVKSFNDADGVEWVGKKMNMATERRVVGSIIIKIFYFKPPK